jgi:hypothetical protein
MYHPDVMHLQGCFDIKANIQRWKVVVSHQVTPSVIAIAVLVTQRIVCIAHTRRPTFVFTS